MILCHQNVLLLNWESTIWHNSNLKFHIITNYANYFQTKYLFFTKDYAFQQVYIKIFNASFQENLINQLYQGEMKDYVKCLKVSYYALSVMIRPLTGRIFTCFWTLKNGE